MSLPRLRRTAVAILAATLFLAACSTTEPSPSRVRPAAPPPPVAAAAEAAVIAQREQAADARRQAERVLTAQAYTKTAAPVAEAFYAPPPPADRENYAAPAQSPVRLAAEQPVSTFSIDVDTGSYSNTRRILDEGRLPPEDAVRVEEFINYFDYGDAPAATTDLPFAVHAELAPTPWNAKTRLLRVALKGYRPNGPLPPSNLVFLVDVSGSMESPDKLPLVKSSLKLLARQLTARDRISLVTYASGTQLVLEPTPGDQTAAIEQAIDRLQAGGGTAGAAGITLAYQQAEKAFIKGGNNRVLLATDGDFNVGITRFESLLDLVRDKRRTGIALTTLGFGTGNYNDHLMEQAADAGDGNYSYIDSLREAQKVLVAQRAATLLTIARDVKVQVEFNPAVVREYRLIGYENRALAREDFNNDQVDAGDIGAGHGVTALYEIALAGEGGERIEALRYGAPAATHAGTQGEVAFVRLRYKRPDETRSRLIEQPVRLADARASLAAASPALRLSAAVAAFGERLRGGRYLEGYGYAQIVDLARGAATADAGGDLGDFLQNVALADSLSARTPAGRD
ncbi:vWA domain-containing protein [Solimonas soli]|uniref:vWA domain-containing protein n=1 Tax=Solimonas soli TaxID=413479 RepID=UPI00047F6EC5|nr:VWA domain-containing protein [Solimonas soli]